jgi:penicillin-binding protein 1C
VTVGVWVGNFDLQPLRGSSGVTGAAPLFNAVMLAAMKRARGQLPIGDSTPVVPPGPDVEQVEICALSGARPSTYCPSVRSEWLPSGAPARFCSWHHDGTIDWPAEYRAWAPKREAMPQKVADVAGMRIVNPPDGATYMIDPTLRREFQTLRLRATSDVKWQVNDRRLASAEWPLTPGRHTITALDSRGRRDSVQIFVK